MLDVGSIIWVGKKLRAWCMERGRENFGDNLFRFNIIRNIALFESVDRSGERTEFHTKSFAPRFRKRAPAKYLDRLAIIVMYTVRP